MRCCELDNGGAHLAKGYGTIGFPLFSCMEEYVLFFSERLSRKGSKLILNLISYQSTGKEGSELCFLSELSIISYMYRRIRCIHSSRYVCWCSARFN